MIMLYVSDQENKKLENMTTQYTDNYVSIIWEDRTYIPFCAIDNSEKGIQIGIVNGDKNDRVYEYRAHSTDEWIISFYKSPETSNHPSIFSILKVHSGKRYASLGAYTVS